MPETIIEGSLEDLGLEAPNMVHLCYPDGKALCGRQCAGKDADGFPTDCVVCGDIYFQIFGDRPVSNG